MRGKPFLFVVLCFFLMTSAWAAIVWVQVTELNDEPMTRFDAWHYALDTTTFRARISPPTKDGVRNETFFKICEEIVTLLTLVLLGWGYSITDDGRDAHRLKKLYALEGGGRSWSEFLRENEPELFAQYYGEPIQDLSRWDRFRKWLLDL